MKKLWIVMICGILCCSALAFAACGEEGHTTHNYGGWEIVTPASCEKEGARKKTCRDCDDVVTEPIPALGHNFVGGICTDCGKPEA